MEAQRLKKADRFVSYSCSCYSQRDTAANTQLFEAASAGNVSLLREALEKGANSNHVSKEGDMLFTLHAAARSPNSKNGSALCARELVESGARVSCALISNRNEPIHEAANAGAAEVCQVLIDASPKCAESENSYGNTALLAATRYYTLSLFSCSSLLCRTAIDHLLNK